MSTDWWYTQRTISVIVDNESWILPYAEKLVQEINQGNDVACLIRNHEDITHGDVAFYLGCVKITPENLLKRHKKNLVVHASDLPKGRGFSPTTWLILAGHNDIPVSLIEAIDEVDAGPIIQQEIMRLQGHELNNEIRHQLGEMHISLCLSYLSSPSIPLGKEQIGEPTFYPRRHPHDSELMPDKTLAEQFNLLRVVDNTRYPAFFYLHGRKYILTINACKDEG